MSLINKIRHGNNSFPLLFSYVLLSGLILFFTSCSNVREPYSIVEFTGSDEVINYSKSLYMFSNKSDSVSPTAVLASEGDLLFYGENCFIYRKELGSSFRFNAEKEGGYINGKITTLSLGKSKYMIPWFKQMKSADLSSLDFIIVDSLISEDFYPYLAELAKIRPGTGISYEGSLSDISRVINLFNPRYLIGNLESASDFELISHLPNLKFLVVALNDSVNNGPLPALPLLKSLIISDVNKKIKIDGNFLSENKSLERLSIMESEEIDFSLLSPLNNLRELVLTNFDTIVNFDLLKNKPGLELFSIIGDKAHYSLETDGLSGLRWMSFSREVTQDVFNSFINNHPDLEVAEIIKNDTIKSLSPLLKLKKLDGLIVTDTLTDLASVKSLKNLRYLSLPSSVLENKKILADLQAAMPGTRIVANEGFCLGTGWLLLIIPFVLFFILVTRRKHRNAQLHV